MQLQNKSLGKKKKPKSKIETAKEIIEWAALITGILAAIKTLFKG